MEFSSMTTAARALRGGRSDWRLHALSVFSLAVAFVCLASALLVVVNLQAVEARWARAGRASIYLKDGVADDDVAALRRALAQTPGVSGTRYLSQADARKDVLGDGVAGALAALHGLPAGGGAGLRQQLSPAGCRPRRSGAPNGVEGS